MSSTKEETDKAPRRLPGFLRRVPPIVWWATGLHVAVLLAYSILLPTYRAPDEPHHVDLAHFVSTDLSYPSWDEKDFDPGVYRSLPLVDFFNGSRDLSSEAAVPKDQRPSFEDLDAPGLGTGINQMPQHPPLYYVVAGGLERLAELPVGDPSYDLETWFYRMVSVLCMAPLPLVIWHTARRLRLPSAVGVAAMFVPMAIPQLAHIGSAANNDNLLALTFWLLTPAVVRLAQGDLRPRTGLLAGAITGAGLLTKGFAVVMPLWVLAALLIAARRQGRARWRDAGVAGLWYGLSALALGGWWWVRNLVVYGEPSPSRFDQIVPPRDDVDVALGSFIQAWAYRTNRRFWGDFGWFDVALPTVVFGIATLVCLTGIVVACTRADRVGNSPIGDRLVLVAPLLLLVALQFTLAFRSHLNTGQLPGLQGRYWFGSVAGVAVVIVLGLANLVRRHTQLLPLGLLLGAVGMQATAVSTLLGHYWGGDGASLQDRLRAVNAWAPMPGELVGIGSVLGAIAGTGTLVAVARMAFGRDEPTSPDPGGATAVEGSRPSREPAATLAT